MTVDVANSVFINGFSVKLVDCFAAGGFALSHRKSDIARAFGALADQVGYDSAVMSWQPSSTFLTHDSQRRELAGDIAKIVRQNVDDACLIRAHRAAPWTG